MTRRTYILLLATTLTLTACSGSGDSATAPDGAADGQALEIAAAFYPLEFLAERLGGEAATVESLSGSGGEPHDLELSPQQVARLSEVDLVLYLEGFQPAVDEAVEQQASGQAFDVAAVTDLEPGYVPLEEGELHEDEQGDDPHVWLDPARYADIASAVAERMGEAAPERADDFTAAARELRTELEELDAEYRTGLKDCARTAIVTSHNAFGYLARAYDLEQVAVTGLTPDAQPAPGRLAEVAELARDSGVTTVFFEDTASPKVAESLAAEVGAAAAVLSPLETAPEQGDYLSAMRANLATLQIALGCSPA
jgi:zinc transport system substrate-binding protein